MTDRSRNFIVLLLVGGLIVGAGAAIALKKTRLGLDLKGGVQLTYKAKPTAQTKVNSESINRTIDIMRKRTDKLGVSQPEINRSGESEISVALPDVSNVKRAEQEVGKTAQLIFYDWEPNVIGASGNPAPTETTATGGANAGAAQFGLPEYQAVQRAAKRPPELRRNETTLGSNPRTGQACTIAQEGGCIYGTWYLVDKAHEKVLRGPEETKENLYADNYKPPAGSKPEVVHVNPGTVVIEARAVEPTPGKVTLRNPDSYFVLKDNPVLFGSDITNPQQSFDECAGGTGAPNVTFGFTSKGKEVFERVTKEIAHRGQEAQLPGVGK